MPFGGFIFGMIMTAVLIVGLIILFAYFIARMLNKRNDRYPRLTVPASVVAKRTFVRHEDGKSFTYYYATFQFESGDRLELRIPRNQIGYLIEGDQGQLTFQGARFLGFERT